MLLWLKPKCDVIPLLAGIVTVVIILHNSVIALLCLVMCFVGSLPTNAESRFVKMSRDSWFVQRNIILCGYPYCVTVTQVFGRVAHSRPHEHVFQNVQCIEMAQSR